MQILRDVGEMCLYRCRKGHQKIHIYSQRSGCKTDILFCLLHRGGTLVCLTLLVSRLLIYGYNIFMRTTSLAVMRAFSLRRRLSKAMAFKQPSQKPN